MTAKYKRPPQDARSVAWQLWRLFSSKRESIHCMTALFEDSIAAGEVVLRGPYPATLVVCVPLTLSGPQRMWARGCMPMQKGPDALGARGSSRGPLKAGWGWLTRRRMKGLPRAWCVPIAVVGRTRGRGDPQGGRAGGGGGRRVLSSHGLCQPLSRILGLPDGVKRVQVAPGLGSDVAPRNCCGGTLCAHNKAIAFRRLSTDGMPQKSGRQNKTER